jgi:hypothetical protein
MYFYMIIKRKLLDLPGFKCVRVSQHTLQAAVRTQHTTQWLYPHNIIPETHVPWMW